MCNISINDIQQCIDKANEYLYSVYPNYKEPDFIDLEFSKAKSYWAQISKSQSFNPNERNFRIRIGGLFNLIEDRNMQLHRLQECMIHELIHTIPKCNNHGRNFKLMAMRIAYKYPQYNVQRETACEDFGIITYKRPKKYVIKCPICGKEYYYCKKPKYHVSLYKCTHCGSDKLEIKII